MKNTYRIIIAAAAGILAAACAKDFTPANGETSKLVPVTFNAVYDDNGAKTQLDPIDENTAHIAFTVGEEISIFYKTTGGAVAKAANNAVCTAYDKETGVATFSALVPEDADLTQEIIAIAGDAKCAAQKNDYTIFDYTEGNSQCLHTTTAKTQTAIKNGYDPANFTSFGIARPAAAGEDRTLHFQTVPGLVALNLSNNSGKQIKAAYVYASTAENPLIYKDDAELPNRYSAMAAEYFFYLKDGEPAQGGSHQSPASYIMMGGFDAAGSEAATYYAVARPDTYSGVKVAFVNEDNKILVADASKGLPETMLVKRNTASKLPAFTISGTAAWQDITLGTECTTTTISEEGGNFKFKVTGNCPWKIALKIDGNSNNTVLYPQDGIGECEVTLKVPALGEGKSSSTYVLTIEEQLPDGTGLTKKKCTLTLTQQAPEPEKPAKITFGDDFFNTYKDMLSQLADSKKNSEIIIGDASLTLSIKSTAGDVGNVRCDELAADETLQGLGSLPAGTTYFQGNYTFKIHENRPGVYKLSFTYFTKSTTNTTPGASVTSTKVSLNGTQVPYTSYFYSTAEGYKNLGSNNKGNINLYNSSAYIENIKITETEDNIILVESGISSNFLRLYCSDDFPIIWERVGDLPATE